MGNRWDGWTDETIARCKELWFEHVPASAIGAEIGATRNMVIAKMNRLGLRKSVVLAIQAGEIPEPPLVPAAETAPETSVEDATDAPEAIAEPEPAPEPVETPSDPAPPESVDEPTVIEAAAPEPEPVPEPEAVAETAAAEDDAHEIDEALADVTASIAEAFSPPEEPVVEEPVVEAQTQPAPKPAARVPSKVTCEGISFFDIREGQCKFPLWDFNNTTPIHEKRFCGCARVGTTSWCEKHLRVVADPIRRGPRPMRAR